MNHPAIAQVFGGSTPEGRPYFVMEYVAGSSIVAHCDREQLPVEARLALLIEVCAWDADHHRDRFDDSEERWFRLCAKN